MYMEYLSYLRTLSKAEKLEQILLVSAIFGALILIGIVLEILRKKYNKQYECVKSFLNKNIFKNKQIKKDV